MKFRLSALARIKEFQQLPPKRLRDLKRMVAIQTYERLTRQAPVLTGRYRWGFNCSLNAIDYTVPPAAPKEYAKTGKVYYDLDADRAIRAFVSLTIDDTAVISNSLPYAEPLENGHSRKAPNGIFRVVVPQVKEDIKRFAEKVKGMG